MPTCVLTHDRFPHEPWNLLLICPSPFLTLSSDNHHILLPFHPCDCGVQQRYKVPPGLSVVPRCQSTQALSSALSLIPLPYSRFLSRATSSCLAHVSWPRAAWPSPLAWSLMQNEVVMGPRGDPGWCTELLFIHLYHQPPAEGDPCPLPASSVLQGVEAVLNPEANLLYWAKCFRVQRSLIHRNNSP